MIKGHKTDEDAKVLLQAFVRTRCGLLSLMNKIKNFGIRTSYIRQKLRFKLFKNLGKMIFLQKRWDDTVQEMIMELA